MNTETEYIQAFNNGYFLALYKPELLKRICQNLSTKNLFLKFFLEGKKHLEMEQERENIDSFREIRKQVNAKSRGR